MQQFSLIHDPYAKLTPSQRLAVTAHNMRRARIAEQAKPDIAPRTAGFEIPNTPYGVPKIRRWQPVDEPAPVYRVWFSIESEIDPQPRKISIKDIQRVAAQHYGVTVNDIVSARRTKDVLMPRQVATYLAKQITTCSLPQISRCFGGRDHTTALSAIRKITRLLETDLELAERIRLIKLELAA
jgi:hypothetical protein